MKNLKKNKPLFFTGIIILMGIGLSLSIFVTTQSSNKASKEENNLKVEAPAPEEKETYTDFDDNSDNVAKETESDGENQAEESPYAVFEESEETEKEIASASAVKSAEESARKLMRKFQFGKASEKLYEAIKKYENSGEASILYTLNNDNAIVGMLSHSHEDGDSHFKHHVEVADDAGRESTIAMIQDPEMALLAVLFIEHESRGKYILNKESLNPLFLDTEVKIGAKAKVSEEERVYEDIMFIYQDVANIQRFEFKVDEHWLYANIITFEDGTSRVHSIVEKTEGSTPYKSVQYWDKVRGAVEREDTFDYHD